MQASAYGKVRNWILARAHSSWVARKIIGLFLMRARPYREETANSSARRAGTWKREAVFESITVVNLWNFAIDTASWTVHYLWYIASLISHIRVCWNVFKIICYIAAYGPTGHCRAFAPGTLAIQEPVMEKANRDIFFTNNGSKWRKTVFVGRGRGESNACN